MRDGGCRGDRVLAAGDDVAAHVEDAGLEPGLVPERDGDRTDEAVALVGGVLANHGGQLVLQRGGVRRQALVVVVAELDDEVVGHQDAARADDRGLVVELALERAADLDRLHLRLEGAREDPLDEAFEPALEALQNTHDTSLSGRLIRSYLRLLTGHRSCPWCLVVLPGCSGEWRNGRRARFRSVCPKGRGGSTPPSPTYLVTCFCPLRTSRTPRTPSGVGAFLVFGRGAGPPPLDCSFSVAVARWRVLIVGDRA